MTNAELRELDAFIAEHVIGLKRIQTGSEWKEGTFFDHSEDGPLEAVGRNSSASFRPTRDPEAAMRALKRCAEKIRHDNISIMFDTKFYRVSAHTTEGIIRELSESLETAICLFAKRLFEKMNPTNSQTKGTNES